MVLETFMKLCVTAEFSGKFFFAPQNWENGPKMVQNRVFWKACSSIFAEFDL